MVPHYVRFALRSLAVNRFQAAASVVVLALGLTCLIAAGLFTRYVETFDGTLPKTERVYVVYQSVDMPTNKVSMPLSARTSFPVADQLRIEVPELDGVARFMASSALVGLPGAEPLADGGVYFVDSDFTRIFPLRATAGTFADALARPQTAVLSTATARSLFGADAAVGKVITISRGGRSTDVTVTAVVDVPTHSHLAFNVLCSWDVYAASLSPASAASWVGAAVRTYALLPADGSLKARAFNRRLEAFARRDVPGFDVTLGFAARSIPELVKDDFATRLQGFGRGGLPLDVTTILLMLGGLILAVGCLNFVNLATARSVTRAREIGVRKALGASVRAVIAQELLQTALLAAVATVLAFALIALAKRALADDVRALVPVPWSEFRFWLEIGLLLVAVTLAAGLYPALSLAHVNPMTALRLGTSKGGPPFLRKLLVGMQFASAAFLCIAVVIAYLQTQALREAAFLHFPDQYVVLNPALRTSPGISFDALAAELERGPGIKGVAGIDVAPWQMGYSVRPMSLSPDGDGVTVPLDLHNVTHDYFAVMDTPLLAGRWFSRERADDTAPLPGEDVTRRARPPAVVLDRRAAARLGWTNPADAVGQLLYETTPPRQTMEVIGVVESQPLALRDRDAGGFAYGLSTVTTLLTMVRVDKAEMSAALAHIDDVWRRVAPNTAVGRLFLDETFDNAYGAFDTTNRIAIGAASFAIAIAAIGLLGMAGFLAVRRTREIGLRKTQGASSGSIVRLLLWDFSKPVLVANLAIWPLAYVAARAYLGLFVERMTLTPLPFVATLAATLLLAWLVVGAYVGAAARLSPAVALRHE
jgi:putative ABC transport system permease protein